MRIRTLLITMLVSAMTLVGVLFSVLWLVHDRLDTLIEVQPIKLKRANGSLGA